MLGAAAAIGGTLMTGGFGVGAAVASIGAIASTANAAAVATTTTMMWVFGLMEVVRLIKLLFQARQEFFAPNMHQIFFTKNGLHDTSCLARDYSSCNPVSSAEVIMR